MVRLLLAVSLLGMAVKGRAEEAPKAVAEAPKAAAEAPKPAAEAPKTAVKKMATGFKTWFQHLREGLTESAVSGQRQKGGVTAVAAVRGAGQSNAELDKPAWKSASRSRLSKANTAQRAELSAAIDLVLDGKLDEGDAKLAAFEKGHPDSPLLTEAKQARSKVKEAQAGSDK